MPFSTDCGSEIYENVDRSLGKDDIYINVNDESARFACATSDNISTNHSIISPDREQHDDEYTSLDQATRSKSETVQLGTDSRKSSTNKKFAFTVILFIITIAAVSVVFMMVVIQPGFNRLGEYDLYL